jgi:hypothetical protein
LGLRQSQDVVFFQNDSKVIHARHGTGITMRKPDVILAFVSDISYRPIIETKKKKKDKKEEEAEAVNDLHTASAAATRGEIVQFVEWDDLLESVEFKLSKSEQRWRRFSYPERYEYRLSSIGKIEPLDVDAEEEESSASNPTEIAEDSRQINTPESLPYSGKRMMLFNLVAHLS